MKPENFKKAVYTFFPTLGAGAEFLKLSGTTMSNYTSGRQPVPHHVQLILRIMYKERVAQQELKEVKEYFGIDPEIKFAEFKKVLELIGDRDDNKK